MSCSFLVTYELGNATYRVTSQTQTTAMQEMVSLAMKKILLSDATMQSLRDKLMIDTKGTVLYPLEYLNLVKSYTYEKRMQIYEKEAVAFASRVMKRLLLRIPKETITHIVT